MTSPLTEDELARAVLELQNWTYDRARRALYRSVCMKDFAQAIAFIVQVAFEAEKVDHHPEWSNVHNRVDVWLTTHSANGVSNQDILMAGYINSLVVK